ncbi:MAG: bifunctional phosphoribosyl-AMP cyclohydrolase/phosphoribosyl-ATP diphosphatase HisIE [Chloroflexi bacterium]|nr:bifunctional phosphoribosyl-AMP cyclohydrolase/phosphoribosyl-ATP diphosphatase HisIE [Chloroflexota bacterium]
MHLRFNWKRRAAEEVEAHMDIVLDAKGLIPAIVQHATTGEVLMHAYMDEAALRKTIETGQAWFYSRSRQELWHKGATSGNYINVKAIEVDCDGDTLLLKGEPTGPVCHTGAKGCFFQKLETQAMAFQRKEQPAAILDELFQVIEDRKRNPKEESYVAKLMAKGPGRIGKKVVEEAGETVVAALAEDRERLADEVADLWFHTLVLLSSKGMTPDDVWAKLRERRKEKGPS